MNRRGSVGATVRRYTKGGHAKRESWRFRRRPKAKRYDEGGGAEVVAGENSGATAATGDTGVGGVGADINAAAIALGNAMPGFAFGPDGTQSYSGDSSVVSGGAGHAAPAAAPSAADAATMAEIQSNVTATPGGSAPSPFGDYAISIGPTGGAPFSGSLADLGPTAGTIGGFAPGTGGLADIGPPAGTIGIPGGGSIAVGNPSISVGQPGAFDFGITSAPAEVFTAGDLPAETSAQTSAGTGKGDYAGPLGIASQDVNISTANIPGAPDFIGPADFIGPTATSAQIAAAQAPAALPAAITGPQDVGGKAPFGPPLGFAPENQPTGGGRASVADAAASQPGLAADDAAAHSGFFSGNGLFGSGMSATGIAAVTGIAAGDVTAGLEAPPGSEARKNLVRRIMASAMNQSNRTGMMASGGATRTALSVAQRYAKGGKTEREPEDHEFHDFARGGLIDSPVPGRTDKLPLKVKSGTYIIPADIVSGLGEGNTKAGVAALDKLFHLGPYGAASHKIGDPKVNYGHPLRPMTRLRARGGRAEAEKALPADHELGMKVPHGGSMCANCKFLSSSTTCGNDAFVKWNGGAKLPAPADEYCCDLYERRGRRAEGGTDDGATDPVKIIAAGGEFSVPPEVVKNLGGGDMSHGHDILDALVLHVRKNLIKELGNLKGPKRD